MATKGTQNILYLMAKKAIAFDADVFHVILMNTGFTFNRATHHKYSDVSASELSAGNGYLQNTKVLAGVSVTRDDTLFKTVIAWSNPQWTATGGPIGPSPGAFILDDTHADKPLVGYIDFGGDGTEPDGGTFTIANPKVEYATNC